MSWLNRVRHRTASFLLVSSFLIFSSFASVAAAQASDPEMEQGLHLLEEGRTPLDNSLLTQARDFFAKLAQQHPDNAVYFYQLAHVDFYRCEAYVSHGDKKNGEKSLDAAIENAQQSIKLNEKSADTHSLLGDLYGRKIGFGMPMFSGPKYGPKSQAENKRALELDANNPRVFASWGREYLNAPKMFGGDLDKAIESFHKSTQLEPNFDETYVWLAIALRKKGDTAGADQALQQALKLNPRSVFAQQTAAKK
jgi:tetratricopeptide (TPR) repeat protein